MYFKTTKNLPEKPKLVTPYPEEPKNPALLTLPHPEEAPDYSRTINNTDLNSALERWEINYNVPEKYRDYWKTKILIKLDADFPYPSAAYERDGIRHLNIKPAWVNPGVIAHEQAHNSYNLLTDGQKSEFSKKYTQLKTMDPLIVLLYSMNNYGLSNDVEGHAEVYRYLGNEMPETLKEYYPKLFD